MPCLACETSLGTSAEVLVCFEAAAPALVVVQAAVAGLRPAIGCRPTHVLPCPATHCAAQVPVALSSFSGKHMHLFLRKDADRLTEDVLTGNATGGWAPGELHCCRSSAAEFRLQVSAAPRIVPASLPPPVPFGGSAPTQPPSHHAQHPPCPPFTDDGSKGSLWDRVSAWRGGGSGKGSAPARLDAEAGAEDDRETIHVFTVASGHM